MTCRIVGSPWAGAGTCAVTRYSTSGGLHYRTKGGVVVGRQHDDWLAKEDGGTVVIYSIYLKDAEDLFRVVDIVLSSADLATYCHGKAMPGGRERGGHRHGNASEHIVLLRLRDQQ